MPKYFSENYVISSPILSENPPKNVFTENWRVFYIEIKWRPNKRKKGLRQKLKNYFPKIKWRPKKKVFTAFTVIWDYIRAEFEEFLCADRLFFVWSSSAQISMGER